MSIEVACPACSRKLLAAEKYLGRRIKCPHCLQSVELPKKGAASRSATVATALDNPDVSDGPGWYVRNANDQQFGPNSKEEIDEWVREGRVDQECQLRKEGWEGWRWADEVYPQLAEQEQATAGQPGETAGKTNPFDVLADAPNPFPQLEPKPDPKDVTTPPLRRDSFRLQLQMTALYMRLVAIYGLLGWPLACLLVFWPQVARKFSPPSLSWISPPVWVLLSGLVTFIPAFLALRYHYTIRLILRDPLQTRWRMAIQRQRQMWKAICLIATAIFLALAAFVAIGFIHSQP